MYDPESPDFTREVAALACASVDPASCGSRDDYALAVTHRAMSFRELLDDDSPVMLALNGYGSSVFRATIDAIRDDKAGHRFIIDFTYGYDRDRHESMPTDHYNGKWGEVVQRLWHPSLVGRNVILYKYNSQPTEEQKAKLRAEGRQVPEQGYRRLVYVKRV